MFPKNTEKANWEPWTGDKISKGWLPGMWQEYRPMRKTTYKKVKLNYEWHFTLGKSIGRDVQPRLESGKCHQNRDRYHNTPLWWVQVRKPGGTECHHEDERGPLTLAWTGILFHITYQPAVLHLQKSSDTWVSGHWCKNAHQQNGSSNHSVRPVMEYAAEWENEWPRRVGIWITQSEGRSPRRLPTAWIAIVRVEEQDHKVFRYAQTGQALRSFFSNW